MAGPKDKKSSAISSFFGDDDDFFDEDEEVADDAAGSADAAVADAAPTPPTAAPVDPVVSAEASVSEPPPGLPSAPPPPLPPIAATPDTTEAAPPPEVRPEAAQLPDPAPAAESASPTAPPPPPGFSTAPGAPVGGVLSGLHSGLPAGLPSGLPAGLPSGLPGGGLPAGLPAGLPSGLPGGIPSGLGAGLPSGVPTGLPSGLPAGLPTGLPAGLPTGLGDGVVKPLDSFFLDSAPDRDPGDTPPPPAVTRFAPDEWSIAEPVEPSLVGEGAAPAAADASPAIAEDDTFLPTWSSAITTLDREAEAGGPAIRVDAARAALLWLRDPVRAAALLERVPDDTEGRARVAAEVAVASNADHAVVAAAAQRVGGSRGAAWLRRVAAMESGGANALAWGRLAAELDPSDLLSWWALRDEAMRQGSEGDVQVALTAIAELTQGEVSADARLALAARKKRLGHSDDAALAIRAAAAADPQHTGVFAALEAELIEAGEWAELADHYSARAEATPDGEARWWWILAARARRTANDPHGTAAAFARAAAAGTMSALPEQLASLLGASSSPSRAADLASALSVACETLAGAGTPEAEADRAALLYLHGLVAEAWLGDTALAGASWQQAAAAGFAPAGDARLGLLALADDAEAYAAALDEQIAAAGEDGAYDARVLRAEIAERSDPSGDDTFAAWAALAARPDATRRALEGVQRVARRRDDTLALVDALERLSTIARTDTGRGELIGEAVQTLRYKLRDAARAAALLKTSPRHVPRPWEIDVAMAVEAGNHADAAGILTGAVAEEEPREAADLLFRAALLLHTSADGAGVRSSVVELLEQALGLDPEHDDASRLAITLSGGARPAQRREAAAASEAPAGPRAVRALAWVHGTDDVSGGSVGGVFDAIAAWISGEPGRAVPWVSALPDAECASIGAALAWMAARHDFEASAAAKLCCDALQANAPGGVAAAHIALMCGNPAAALRALEGSSNLAALAAAVRIAESIGGAALTASIAALDAYRAPNASAEVDGSGDESAPEGGAPATGPGVLPAARARLRAARGDHQASAAAHLALAALEDGAGLRAAHGRRANQLFLALGQADGALEALAATVRALADGGLGDHAEIWEALAEAQRAAGQAEAGLETLAGAPLAEEERARLVAEFTTRAGLPGQLDAWELAAAAAGLYERLGHELALCAEERWADLFDAWTGRMESASSADERASLERRRRALLADKLAETELALELYERLHAESPHDRDVLENLARVAGARGETDRSIAWLEELAESAATPADAARYHRRIAETWIRANDDAYARQAFLNALDFQPDDQAALTGLEQLAAKACDWEALRSVLQRKASICPPDERKDVLRQIAVLVDDRFDDRGEALDAWRAVSEADPKDSSALWRMLDLAEAAGELDVMLEVGNQLEARLEGGERSRLLCRMGHVSEELGRRDDAIHYFEQAAAAEEPDPQASVRLEALYRAGQDHAGVVRAILAQASLATDDAVRVERMLAAARIEQDSRHDREAASRLYEEILRVDPDQRDALRLHSDWLWDTGRGEDALPLFDRLAAQMDEAGPGDDADARLDVAVFQYRYAEVLRQFGRADAAITRYLAGLEQCSHHLPSLEAVGPLLIEHGMWDEAATVWGRVYAITAGSSDLGKTAHVLTQIARVDAARGDADRAWAGFNKALTLHPNDVAALRGLANILEERQDWNALLTAYNNIIYHATLPQDVITAYMTKGRVLDENLDRQDKAVQHYERSLAFEARQPAAYLRLAELALRREAWDDAITYATRGLELEATGPLGADLHIARALALLALDGGGAAEAEIAEAVAAEPGRAALLGAAPLSEPLVVRAALRARLPR